MKKLKIDYRHFICIFITLAFICCTVFVFPYAFKRLFEGGQDIWNSLVYYTSEIFMFDSDVLPTVNNFTAQPFTMPFGLPETWEEFSFKLNTYSERLFDSENFNNYLLAISDVLFFLCQMFLILLPVFLLLYALFKRYFENENNDYNKDSASLKFVKFLGVGYVHVKKFFVDFFSFVKSKKYYRVLWFLIWCLNFNIFTIIIEALAYYFYFIVWFDFSSLSIQLYKLLGDLSAMFNFVPVAIWIVVGAWLFHSFRKKIALRSLHHKEMMNRGFLNSRSLALMAVGSVGKNKTTFITDSAVSFDIMLRNKAFEKILENDLKFPFFPWCNLENVMRKQMENHIIYNLATTKKFIRKLKRFFYLCEKYPERKSSVRLILLNRYGIDFDNLLFDYDYKRYGFTHNDKLKVVDVWEVVETYAQLYFIYVIESTYIQSNYAIRTDNVLSDLGNFPLWDTDFFERDSRLIDAYSRHSHILDFDMLRLGKKVIEDNKNANAFEFGVIVITEIGKERGNNLENVDKKKKDEIANQKNDMFNSWLKMVRHSATVDNFPFVRVITDDQRPTSWGSDARDLCDIIHIKESCEIKLAMPFFAFEELFYKFIFSKFTDLYYRYRYVRSDNTVPMYFLKKLTSMLHNYYTGIYNRFGFRKLVIQVESGTLDGALETHKYFLMNKKIYSKRFSTDCYSEFFMEKALRSPVGLNDLQEFASEKATFEELMKENAYFMRDIVFGLSSKAKEE